MSGIVKAIEKENGIAFQTLMLKLQLLFKLLNTAGLGIFIGLLMISIPLLKKFIKEILSTDKLFSK